MGKFDFLKEYVFNNPKDKDIWNNKYVFFKINQKDIEDYENKLGQKLPGELKDFYKEIGYGFLRCDINNYINRIMAPCDIFNFVNGIKEFSNDDRRKLYKNPTEIVFYEVSEDSCLTLDLSKENSNGESPLYYNGTKIANSIWEFIKHMDDEADYYLNDI